MNMKPKGGVIATAVALAAFMIGAAAAGSAGADTINLRLGSGHPQKALEYTKIGDSFFVPELIRRVKQATGDDVVVQQLHAGAIAKVKEVLETTRDGLLDIGLWVYPFEPTNAFLQSFNFYLPFNSSNATLTTLATRATFDKYPELRTVYEKNFNQKVLATVCVGNYGLGTNFAWSKFDDLKGHKIAGAGSNLNWIKGATPVSSNLNEAYQAIQSGVYEGYIIFPGSWFGFKLHEIGKNFMKTDFGTMAIIAMTVNLDRWNKLSPEVRDIMAQVAKEYEIATANECTAFGINGENKLLDAGVTVKQLSFDSKVAWCKAVADFPNRMAQDANKRGLPGTGVMKYYIETISKMGHEFPCEYKIE